MSPLSHSYLINNHKLLTHFGMFEDIIVKDKFKKAHKEIRYIQSKQIISLHKTHGI